MKAAISGETLGSVMELDEILSLFQKNGIHFIEIWPENIPVKVGKTLLHKRLYANRDVEQAKKILEKYQIKAACVCFGAGFDKELAKDPELFSRELERAVEIAYELGAKVVNHYVIMSQWVRKFLFLNWKSIIGTGDTGKRSIGKSIWLWK